MVLMCRPPGGRFSNRVPPVNSLFACFKADWTEFSSANASKSRYFPNNRTQWSVDGMSSRLSLLIVEVKPRSRKAIPTEAARRYDCLKLAEIEFADRAQCQRRLHLGDRATGEPPEPGS